MDSIQATVLRIKLRSLDSENQARRGHARSYGSGLADLPRVTTPVCAADRLHVFHLYVIRVRMREKIKDTLAKEGISCGVHYPVPAHLQPACAGLGFRHGDFPVSERCAAEFLSLPMFPELTPQQVDCVVQSVKRAISACSVE